MNTQNSRLGWRAQMINFLPKSLQRAATSTSVLFRASMFILLAVGFLGIWRSVVAQDGHSASQAVEPQQLSSPNPANDSTATAPPFDDPAKPVSQGTGQASYPQTNPTSTTNRPVTINGKQVDELYFVQPTPYARWNPLQQTVTEPIAGIALAGPPHLPAPSAPFVQPEPSINTTLRRLQTQFLQADADQKIAIRKQIEQVLTETFESRHAMQKLEIERLASQIELAKELLAKRQSQKQQIIAQQTTKLLETENELAFDFDPAARIGNSSQSRPNERIPTYSPYANNYYNGGVPATIPSYSPTPPSAQLPATQPPATKPQLSFVPAPTRITPPAQSQTNPKIAMAPFQYSSPGELGNRLQRALTDVYAEGMSSEQSSISELYARNVRPLESVWQLELQKLATQLRIAELELEQRRAEYADLDSLFNKGAVDFSEFRAAKFAVEKASLEVDQIRQQYHWMGNFEKENLAPLWIVTAINGLVTLDGQPAIVKIRFEPSNGNGQPIECNTDENGRYSWTGFALAGNYKAYLSSHPDSNRDVPTRYKDEPLRVTINSSKSNFDFELSAATRR